MLEAVSSGAEARQRTPEHLVRTAERLYAQQGITAVSLRQIVAAAGHRNPAAIQYHFGSRDGLLRAIVESRVGLFNDRRLAMLDALHQRGRDDDLRGVVEAVVLPFAQDEPPGAYYVRFLARLSAHRAEMGRVFASVNDEYGASVRRVQKALERCLAPLPPAVKTNRIAMAMSLTVNTLADRQERAEAGEDDLLPRDAFVSDLVDAVVGLLGAPPSPGTVEGLTRTA
jgi:AcrR family transcriptional regulator